MIETLGYIMLRERTQPKGLKLYDSIYMILELSKQINSCQDLGVERMADYEESLDNFSEP